MLFQNFSIIGFATKELHLSEVEGVELFIFSPKFGLSNLLF
jgi:hypothetical protein